MTPRPLTSAASIAAVIVCALVASGAAGFDCAGAGTGFSDDAGPDAGEDLAENGCDAGPDGGCAAPQEAPQECDALVEQCCGETCGESAACEAAQLLRAHEPERCADALTDAQTFPQCELGACDSLVVKVCGPTNECADAPGCAPAQTLQARTQDPNATQQEIEDASSSCLQALEDDVVFASCT